MTDRLTEIMSEFKLPFEPNQHRLRKIKGGGYWIYVPYTFYLQRAIAIAPEMSIDFSDYTIKTAFTRQKCTVSLFGISRSVWGVVETSPTGERGNCCERATAEATKNALEFWGMGAYLDDQRYAWQIMSGSKGLTQSELSDLKSYGASLGVKADVSYKPSTVPRKTVSYVSEPEIGNLSAIARDLGVQEQEVTAIALKYGYKSLDKIQTKDLEKIVEDVKASARPAVEGLRPQYIGIVKELARVSGMGDRIEAYLLKKGVQDPSCLTQDQLFELVRKCCTAMALNVVKDEVAAAAIAAIDGAVIGKLALGIPIGQAISVWEKRYLELHVKY